MLINIIMLFPPFLFLRFREASVGRDIAIVNQTPEIQRASVIEQRIVELNARLDAFERDEEAMTDISGLFEPVLHARDNAITITFFAFLPPGNTRAAPLLQIRGTAQTRDALINFADRLKTEPRYQSVVFPVEDLLRDHDILFSITISVRG